ncbi:hypothetical protein [Aestuariirhabdus sp. LZHN29]|uniref:hypothetical protein n=1 Tax=Aestuariirhabdus sp. LZHN29 TaxID=3417462 RepID=UPI003CF2A2B2
MRRATTLLLTLSLLLAPLVASGVSASMGTSIGHSMESMVADCDHASVTPDCLLSTQGPAPMSACDDCSETTASCCQSPAAALVEVVDEPLPLTATVQASAVVCGWGASPCYPIDHPPR